MSQNQAKARLFEEFAVAAKALSNPTRLELVDLLGQGERTVEALADAAGIGMSTCSAHLQTLKHARLVESDRQGKNVRYRLAGPDVAALYIQLQLVAAEHNAELLAARTAFLGPDDTEHVDRAELLRRVRSGAVTVLDVRPHLEYEAGHIPGAVSIPLAELPARLDELPDTEIVAYCRGEYCVLSHDAVRMLASRGFKALRLADGMLEWRLAGLPFATGEAA